VPWPAFYSGVLSQGGKTSWGPNKGAIQNIGIGLEKASNFKCWEINHFASPIHAKSSSQGSCFQKMGRPIELSAIEH
jgi:hypothetical protein